MAYRRELLKTADEDAAQQRVLDRFGNPQRIAYQLWFQALWGRIMLSRFARVWQGLKIVGGIVVLFLVFRMADQQSMLSGQLQLMTASYNSMQSQAMGTRNLLEQVLQRLPEPPPSVDPNGMPMGGGDMGGGSPMMGMSSSAMAPGAAGGESSNMTMPGMSAGATSASAVSKPDLIVRLTMEGDDAKPATGCVVAVVNEYGGNIGPTIPNQPMSEMSSAGAMPAGMGFLPSNHKALRQFPKSPGIQLFEWQQGQVHFHNIQPGRYTAYVEFEDGRQCAHRFVLPPDNAKKPHVEQIRCPGPEQMKTAYTVIRTSPLPPDLVDAKFSVCVHLAKQLDNIQTGWRKGLGNPFWNLICDPKTGMPTGYSQKSYLDERGPSGVVVNRNLLLPWMKLDDLDVAERFLVLPEGKYRVWLTWVRGFEPAPLNKRPEYPDSIVFGMTTPYTPVNVTADGMLQITPEKRDVLLEIPPEMLEAARAVLKPAAVDLSAPEATKTESPAVE